jgi:hypothetical protein
MLKDLDKFSWEDHPANPIISAPFPDYVLADPFVLAPDESPDKKWHMFAHGVIPLYHYISDDGIVWKKKPKIIGLLSYRPFIYQENDIYYLFYEKITNPHKFPFNDSQIEVRHSTDLNKWSKPKIALKSSLPWHTILSKKGNVGNPCVIKIGNKYRLYYSSGHEYVSDCKFCEPKSVGIAESSNIEGPYISESKPLFSNIGKENSIRLITGMRVFPGEDFHWGLQTHLTLKTKNAHSTASIKIAKSRDGRIWETIAESIINADKPWKKTHAYVGYIKEYQSEIRIYYNGRKGYLPMRGEAIGLAIGRLKK